MRRVLPGLAVAALPLSGAAHAQSTGAILAVVDFIYKTYGGDDAAAAEALASDGTLKIEDLSPGGEVSTGPIDLGRFRQLTSPCLVTLPAKADDVQLRVETVAVSFCKDAAPDRQWSAQFFLKDQKITKIELLRIDAANSADLPVIGVSGGSK